MPGGQHTHSFSPSSSFDKSQMVTKKGLGGILGFLAVVVLAAWVALNTVERSVREQSVEILQDVLHATNRDVRELWAKSQMRDARRWASDESIIQNTKRLLAAPRNRDALLADPALAAIRRSFQKDWLKLHSALGIFIISPDYINIASMRDTNIGEINLAAKQRENRIERVFQGQSQLIPPLRSDVPLPDESGKLIEGHPTMFVAVPILDERDRIIAALTIRIDPFADFTLLTQTGRIGLTGETYAFDRTGRLLTGSRFDEHLRSVGLIGPDDYSMLAIDIRDPGGNMLKGHRPSVPHDQLPLTYMAERAVTGAAGSSAESYRDYRGVPVIGAWLWDDELDIGFTSEIDESEALKAYRHTRVITVSVLCVAVLLTFLLLLNMHRIYRCGVSAIEESETYLRMILDNAVDAIITIDERGTIETYNAAAERLFGYSAHEVMGKNVNTLMPEPFRSEHDGYIQKYLETGKASIIGAGREVTGARKDGSTFPMRLAVSETYIANRRIFIGIVNDISERKRAQEEILREKKFSEIVINSLPGLFYVQDEEGRIVRWNRYLEDSTGYFGEELERRTPTNWFVEEDKAKVEKNVQEVFSKGAAVLEARVLMKDGRSVPFFLTGLRMEMDGKAYLVGVGIDITERKQAEEEVIRARDAAKAADRAKSVFLANMSHQLRTPLNAVDGYSQFLEKNPDLTAEQREHVNVIRRSGRKLMQLFDDLLEMSKLESGGTALKICDIDTKAMLKELESRFRPQTDAKAIQFECNSMNSIPRFLRTDGEKLNQILVKLIANAVKFTEKGGVVVRISIRKEGLGKAFLVFEVEDTGVGIAEEDVERIFDHFEQTTMGSESKGGVGLGLSIAKEYVLMLGGEISVSSKVGVGSTFRFSIPVEIIGSEQIGTETMWTDTDGDGQAEELTAADTSYLSRESMGILPADLVNEMREATENCAMTRLTELIDSVSEYDEELVKGLRVLTDQYDYDALLALLKTDGASDED